MPTALAQALVDRSLLTTGLDDAIFTTHWELTALDHANRDAATTKLKTFWTAVAAYLSTTHVLREVKWYDVSATVPHTAFKESILTGAAPGTPGASAGLTMPPQVSVSVTLKTQPRKHWGRFYLPGVTGSQLDDNGHKGALKPSVCDAIAAAARTLAQPTGGASLIIYSRPAGVTYFPTEVQVDDVVDVIRKRRMRKATYKKAIAV